MRGLVRIPLPGGRGYEALAACCLGEVGEGARGLRLFSEVRPPHPSLSPSGRGGRTRGEGSAGLRGGCSLAFFGQAADAFEAARRRGRGGFGFLAERRGRPGGTIAAERPAQAGGSRLAGARDRLV